MKLKLFTYLLFLFPLFAHKGVEKTNFKDYLHYHKQINEAERLISTEHFKEALYKYENVFDSYDFIFLRDYKVAAQIAFYLNEKQKSLSFIKKGIEAGWDLNALRRNKFLKDIHKNPEWITIEQSYSNIRRQYETRIDRDLREKVRLMFKKDQKKAMGALFRIGNKAQERYGTRKFAPHSENQMFKLIEILNNDGFPGEKIIDNNFWMSTIISHHNSISLEYSKKDTLYNFVKPKLIRAIENGKMSPYEFALIDDWHKAVASERTKIGYGFLISPKKSTLVESNLLRSKVGLRSIELRNKLVDIENKTGMNFYLPNWIKGKINID